MTFSAPLEPVARHIVRCLILSPRTLNELAAQLKGFEYQEIRDTVRKMRDDGTLTCTGKRWYLRGLARAELHKVQNRETELQEIFKK